MQIRTARNGEHRCSQTQCGFFLAGGCRNCDDCDAPTYIINEGCKRCTDCETQPNSLRFGEKGQQKEKEKTKVMEVEVR